MPIRARGVALVMSVCLAGGIGIVAYLMATKALRPPRASSSHLAHSSSDSDNSEANDDWFADPRLNCDSPWKNVRPGVKYVGDRACAQCHKTHASDFHNHPMGRSAFLPDDVLDDEPTDAKHHNPFDAFGFRHLVRRENGEQWHDTVWLDPDDRSKEIVSIKERVAVAIGSGVHSRSYLVEHDGYVFESPHTWYGQKQRWDISPGYESWPKHQFFNRPILEACLFCHVQHVDPVPHTLNRYQGELFQGAIGCERCHGPGELHVRARYQEPVVDSRDDTIVNPKWLSPKLREMICVQCHLQADVTVIPPGRDIFDYRPGLPLPWFVEYYVTVEAEEKEFRAVGQVEQMYSSRCFRESNRKNPDDSTRAMGCTTCHDPHRAPTPQEAVVQYRNACLRCHSENSCSVPREQRIKDEPQDSCAHCHMPKKPTLDIPHFSLTEHRILRAPGTPGYKLMDRALAPDEPSLVPFFDGQPEEATSSAQRSRAIASMIYLQKHSVGLTTPMGQKLIAYSRKVLEPLVREHPADADAVTMHALALALAGRPEQALVEVQQALTPKRITEQNLVIATIIADLNGRVDLDLEYTLKLKELNPMSEAYRKTLMELYREKGDLERVVEEGAWLMLHDPAATSDVKKYIMALWSTGRRQKAEEEFEKILKLNPDNSQELRVWWADKPN